MPALSDLSGFDVLCISRGRFLVSFPSLLVGCVLPKDLG